MSRSFLFTILCASSMVLALSSISNSYALEMQQPCDIKGCEQGGWNGVPGPGPGDPSLDPSQMPPGGDNRNTHVSDNKKDAEDQVAKPHPSPKVVVHSLGRVKSRPIDNVDLRPRARR